ncbi:tubulin-specific chaperone C-like [Rhopalosiphum maidis]|uniref:tubulin-specific chaperone C-like n=1 Tax=Rhopalosiphum maidis TaxID=43146 RepID=UPI000EFE946C|nr:tubulin-specific chaperone C-like [Rhopalosiphum maidis]XP_026818607.1 tubulin-specific chaperone C-like [Rhopalosiphum maidis]
MEPAVAEEPINQKSSFDFTFKTKSNEINDMLISIENNKTDNFHNILQKINELQEFLNDSKTFLPAYNMKKCSDEIKYITQRYEQLHEKLQPKKKFAFSEQPTTSAVAKSEDEFEPVNQLEVYKEDCGFKNRSDAINLVLTEQECYMKNVVLDTLTNCLVVICGTPNTVRATSLTDCYVYVCAQTLIFIENCKDSIFICASQQLRIHDTFDTSFYIYVASSTIIENSKQLRFAPLSYNSSALLKKAFRMANFDEFKNNWKIVNDLDWLSSYEPSPNWCEIPEEERQQPNEETMLLQFYPRLLNMEDGRLYPRYNECSLGNDTYDLPYY